MKNYILLFVSIISVNINSQIAFEQGYFINNANQKINCLLKNKDWKNNPEEFQYKLNNNDDPKIETIKTVKEFGIENSFKYVRATVDIDRSSENIDNLSDLRNANFKEETIFLKALIEGEANLYEYKYGSLNKFFYSIIDKKITQLIFKQYLIEDKIGNNTLYKNQLIADMNCDFKEKNKINDLKYKKEDLLNFFIRYNQCKKNSFINYDEKEQKLDLLNLTVRPGVNISSLSIKNEAGANTEFVNYGNNVSFRLGIEAEVILPFNKNKWGLFVEPSFQKFEANTTQDNQKTTVNYQSIQIPIGVRHYLFLNKNAKFFINGALVLDFSDKESSITFEKSVDLSIASQNTLALGGGFKYKDKFSVELRYLTTQDILNDFQFWNSEYRTLSIILGYTIF